MQGGCLAHEMELLEDEIMGFGCIENRERLEKEGDEGGDPRIGTEEWARGA